MFPTSISAVGLGSFIFRLRPANRRVHQSSPSDNRSRDERYLMIEATLAGRCHDCTTAPDYPSKKLWVKHQPLMPSQFQTPTEGLPRAVYTRPVRFDLA